ncbi:acylphosphatase [Macrococcoides bohemicum]|uniref:acylphosphatase n=1 Tax=Macrococcoides bohemicum TaxID=1903056 RepID=A0A328A7T1_9STAP|nr:acylphosphatase [Macrococcus bohemicus]RAK50525.1 acylphosphatase [Macrococcus bohemicus]
MKTIHIKVFGRVQGVGFRYFTAQHANDNNITGTVQNVDDYVEIYATGESSKLDIFTEKVIRGASPMSRVQSYEINNIPEQQFKHFKTI